MKKNDLAATPLYNLWQRKRRWRRRVVVTLLLLLIVIWWQWPQIWSLFNKLGHPASTTEQKSGTLPKETPSYRTILPGGVSIETLGGWARVSPPGRESVFAYADKIGKVSITVSEQPTPSSFKTDPAKSVEDLAKSYSATRFVTAGNTKVYIGSSAGGPQSVIFLKSDLLVLIKSSAEIADNVWISYVEMMR